MKKIIVLLSVLVIGLLYNLKTNLDEIDQLIDSNHLYKIQLLQLEEEVAELKPTKSNMALQLDQRSLKQLLQMQYKTTACEVNIKEFSDAKYIIVETDFIEGSKVTELVMDMMVLIQNMYNLSEEELLIVDSTGQPYLKKIETLEQTHVDINKDGDLEDIRLIMVNEYCLYLRVDDTYTWINSFYDSQGPESLTSYLQVDLHTSDSVIVVGFHIPVTKYGSYSEFKCYIYNDDVIRVFSSNIVAGFSNAKLDGKRLSFEDYHNTYDYMLNETTNDDPGIRRLFDVSYKIVPEENTITTMSILQADASPESIVFYTQYKIVGGHLSVVKSGFDKDLADLFDQE